jgi:membrane protein involved in colicin uptake
VRRREFITLLSGAAAEGIAPLETYLQRYPSGTHSRPAKLLIEKFRQEEASRAALQKKAEEEALAKRQQEERIAAERREAEERARRKAEENRQVAAELAKAAAEPQKIASLPQASNVDLPADSMSDPTTRARSLQAELKRVGCERQG